MKPTCEKSKTWDLLLIVIDLANGDVTIATFVQSIATRRDPDLMSMAHHEVVYIGCYQSRMTDPLDLETVLPTKVW